MGRVPLFCTPKNFARFKGYTSVSQMMSCRLDRQKHDNPLPNHKVIFLKKTIISVSYKTGMKLFFSGISFAFQDMHCK